MSKRKIKPCPFCGAEAEYSDEMGVIMCSGCGFYFECPTTIEDALATWNMRGGEIIPKKPRVVRVNSGQFKAKTNQYHFKDNYVAIELNNGNIAKIDAQFYSLCKRFYWSVKTSESGNKYACARDAKNGYKSIFLHRLILQPEERMCVDHINRDGLDCRVSNMRVCTKAENCRNRVGTNSIKGVSAHRGKWQAKITKNYVQIYLGLYDTAQEAAEAYNKAAIANFGEFARLNTIDKKYLRRNNK